MDIVPVIDVHQNNGVLVTTSRNIAEVFHKEHYNVIRDIKAILEKCSPEFTALNFEGSSYRTAQNKEAPMYLLTKDGVMMLIMGYMGEKAMLLKEAYIKRFNEMEQELKQRKNQIEYPNLVEKITIAQIVLSAAKLRDNQLALALDKVYKKTTGESILAAADVKLIAPQQVQLANPTQLGKELGIGPRKVNQLLHELDYQIKTPSGWEPTQNGLDMGAQLLDVGKAHSDGTPIRQLKWPYSIIDELRLALEEEV